MSSEPNIVNAIMSTFSNVQNVEVSGRPGGVTIVVTTDLRNSAEQYNLRSSILEMLEQMRPAGVGYDLMLKSFDDGSLIIFREMNLGVPARNVGYTYNVNERDDTRDEDWDDGDSWEETTPAQGTLSRFSAVAAEITESIKPLMKSTAEPRLYVPRLFEQAIRVELSKPSACPKCSCFAFEPNAEGTRITCRGCPLPSPVYAIEPVDSTTLTTSRYKCGSCGRDSRVTMGLGEINLYCPGCNKLSLHSLQVNVTKVLSGKKATMTFKNVTLGIDFAKVDEVIEYSSSDAIDAVELDKALPPGKGYSVSFTTQLQGPSNWAETIEKLQQRVSSAYELTKEQLAEINASPASQLAEMFRVKLGLQPFALYEQTQRNENIMREGKDLSPSGRDRERRTGRTTKGLVRAIAEYVVSDLRFLAIVGGNVRHTKDLVMEAINMREKLQLARAVEIRPLMPDDFDPRFDYKTQRAHVYVDHYYDEQRYSKW